MRKDEPRFYVLPVVATALAILVLHFTIQVENMAEHCFIQLLNFLLSVYSTLFQAVYPLGKIDLTTWACVSSYLFSAFMLHQPVRITDHKHNEYVLATISMYVYLIKLRCFRWLFV